MPPDTEVISCPACNHLLRLPINWLGREVRCPECKALFRAPVRNDDGIARPELLGRPAPPTAHKRLDAMLFLPTFGLLMCGFAGLVVNGMLTFLFLADPDGSKQYVLNQMPEFRKAGFGADDPPEREAKIDSERAEAWANRLRWAFPFLAGASTVAFLGGLSIALRWNYRLAQAGCIGAALDVTGLCCVPGAIAGLWGLLMLNAREGREHFGR